MAMMSSGPSLPQVGGGHLMDNGKIPEEEETVEDYVTSEPQTPKLKGKARFGSIAFKVLTQIVKEKRLAALDRSRETPYIDRTLQQDENKNASLQEKPEEKSVNTPRAVNRTKSKSQLKPLTRQPSFLDGSRFGASSGSSFASIVRLARFRRMSKMWNQPKGRRRSGSMQSEMSVLPEDETVELPMKPRFCATLSPEAQYAMLRGYEDVIIKELRKSHPEVSPVVHRADTPQQVSIPSPRTNFFRCENGERLLPARENTDIVKDNNKTVHTLECKASTDLNLYKRKGKEPLPKISKEKQLLLSYRFQRAMDIVDSMKSSQGEIVTSPRIQAKPYNDPLNHFRSWSQSWTKEFPLPLEIKGTKDK